MNEGLVGRKQEREGMGNGRDETGKVRNGGMVGWKQEREGAEFSRRKQ